MFAIQSIITAVLSLSCLLASAAPVAVNVNRAVTSAGWPHSTDPNDEKSAFGVSGNFKNAKLVMKDSAPTLVASYAKGSYAGSKSPGISGFIFNADGGAAVTNAKEAVLNYQVQFPEGFDFVLAGKLPGLYGGDDLKTAGTCAGGHHNDACWSARLMWREKGKGELYGYLPTANQKLPVCKGKCDVKFGASIDTGAWTFQPGKWTNISERVKLNDVGKMNGEIEVTVDGDSKIFVKNLMLRTSVKGRIQGAMVHTFFGGSSSTDYQTPKAQQAFFRGFSIQTTEKL